MTYSFYVYLKFVYMKLIVLPVSLSGVTSVNPWYGIPLKSPFWEVPVLWKFRPSSLDTCCIHVSQLTLTHKQAEQPNTPLDLAFHKHLFKSIYFFQSHITFYSRSINIFTTKTFHKRITIFTKLKESRQQKERIREKYQKKWY